VRNKSVWERACRLTEMTVEGVDFDEESEAIVVAVWPVAKARGPQGSTCSPV
jgi:hypothetical protein